MDTENIILKNIIEDKSYFNRVKSILNPKIFTENSSSEIYKIITDFYEKYQNIPTLQEIALKAQDLPVREVRSNIATKLREISLQENINKDFLDDLSVKFVKDQMFTQALMFGSEFIDKKDENAKQKAKDLIEKAQLISINDDLGSDYNNIDERIDYYQNPKKGIKFQRFETLNKFIGDGFLKGTLNVFLAPAGVGKSLLMSTTIGDFLCQGLNILLISMEMSNFEFMKRIDADLLDIEINSLKNVDPTIIKNKFEENKSKFGKLYVQNYPAGAFSANTLASLLEMYKANNITFDAVYLDYLGLMASDKVSANAGLYSFIKSIGEEVRAVACQYQIPVFSASQLNRNSINNTQTIDNSFISDSLGTAMTADWMCFLLQNELMKAQGLLNFKITKNRYNGLTSEFTMNVDYQKMRVEEEHTFNNIQEKKNIENQTNELLELSNLNDLKNMNIQSLNNLEWN